MSVFVKSNNVQDKLNHEDKLDGYLLDNRPLNINIFFDCFSAYCSFAQNNRGIARDVNNGGTFSTRSIAQINYSVNFIADLFGNFGSSRAFRRTG